MSATPISKALDAAALVGVTGGLLGVIIHGVYTTVAGPTYAFPNMLPLLLASATTLQAAQARLPLIDPYGVSLFL
jgi:hypothetical protein